MIRYCLLILALAALPTAARAGINCSVSTSPVNFGNVSQLETSYVDITGTITLNCGGGSGSDSYAACIDIAPGPLNSHNHREIANGSAILGMQLFTDPTRTVPWGSTWSGQAPLFLLSNSGGSQTVYGRLYIYGHSPAAGNYSGFFTVMATYGKIVGGTPTCATLQ